MIVDMPSTSTKDVVKRLVRLGKTGEIIHGPRVLTLIVSAQDTDDTDAIIKDAETAARMHPCRVIILISGNPDSKNRLDAQIRSGGDAGVSEIVIFRIYGSLAEHSASVTVPFLLPDTPIVAWWPTNPPINPVQDPVGSLAQRRITDVSQVEDKTKILSQLGKNYAPGDTDLTWTRITYIRGLLVSALDQPPHLPIRSATVSAPERAQAEGDLFAAWIKAQADVPVTRVTSKEYSIVIERENKPITVSITRDYITVCTTEHPTWNVPYRQRTTAEVLSQELRRLGSDEIYGLALHALPTVKVKKTAAKNTTDTSNKTADKNDSQESDKKK